MKKSRFKRGDKVVFSAPDSHSREVGITEGFEGTVSSTPTGRVIFLIELIRDEAIQAYDEELEFADIYNSPLWKALR